MMSIDRTSRLARQVPAWMLIVLALLALYAIMPRVFLEDMMLFPSQYAPPAPAKPPYAGAVLLSRPVDGGAVEAILVQPTVLGAPAPLVVYFHGNAELADYQPHIVEGYGRLGFAVLLPEYRGYGRSAGKPSQEAIRSDAIHFLDQALARPGIDRGRLVIHGRSLGGGVAADLAAHRGPSALVLESTFTSVPAMAWSMGLPGFFAKNKFATDAVVKDAAFPILLFHGDVDDVIPVSHGRKLRDSNPRITYVEYHCAHNDFPGGNDDDYWKRIAAFVGKI